MLPKPETWRLGFGRVKRLLIAAVILLCSIGAAYGQNVSCTVTPTGPAFGDVTSALLANQTSSTTGTIGYSCSGFQHNSTGTVCLSLGNFNGSNTRSMTAGANTLNYQIYQDSGFTTVWGDSATNGIETIQVSSDSSGNASGSATMYAKTLTGQTTTPAGSYTQTFASGNPNQVTAARGTGTPCTSITSNPTGISFTTTATVSNLCTISTSSVNFGSVTSLSSGVPATGSVTLQCTNGDAYNVGLNAGTGSGATISNRLMTKGSSTIIYSLYQNGTHTSVWGTTLGTNTVAGTGTGANQTLTVFGLVPSQTIPAPGTYTDTVVATVTY